MRRKSLEKSEIEGEAWMHSDTQRHDALSMRFADRSPSVRRKHASLYWNKSDEILTADALILEHSANGFGKHVGNRELFYLCSAVRVGDRVGEDNLFEG